MDSVKMRCGARKPGAGLRLGEVLDLVQGRYRESEQIVGAKRRWRSPASDKSQILAESFFPAPTSPRWRAAMG